VCAALAALVLSACSESAPEEPPAMAAEAGFIEIEPVAYAVHGDTSLAATSSRARLFVSFHPADEAPDERPLLVVYSGGPGAATGILLGGNTAPSTLDPGRTGGAPVARNATSWTAFANLLYVDARGTGFSYGIAPGMADEAQRAAEFSVRNFHPFLDAADIVRVVLRFLAAHPRLRAAPVVLAGESYGGVRTEVALHLLHHPERYRESAALYQDPALAAEIEAHFAAAGTDAAAQFDRAVFLQPRLSSPFQQAAAGAALEAAGSPLHAVADETGVPFVPCSEQAAPCSPFANVVAYLAAAGRDLYDVRKPAGDAFALYAEVGARLEDPAVLSEALGSDPLAIVELRPSERGEAYRVSDAPPEDEPLAGALGALSGYDRYFEIELFDLLGKPFSGPAAQALGIERQHARYGRLFLEDLLTVRALVTNAAFDAAIWTPALPAALAMYSDVVESVQVDGAAFSIAYRPGAFGAVAATSRTVRFPGYAAAGHSISFDQPEDLAADLAAFLAE
jgi:hypothetical protein